MTFIRNVFTSYNYPANARYRDLTQIAHFSSSEQLICRGGLIDKSPGEMLVVTRVCICCHLITGAGICNATLYPLLLPFPLSHILYVQKLELSRTVALRPFGRPSLGMAISIYVSAY